jgi:two-component system alkaline phosphatase synthesis response regulator PhoP
MPKKILVIDDEEEAVIYLRNILQRANYEVIYTTKGKEGVDLALELRPDLILLDIMLPDIDGFEVLDRLKSKWIESKISSVPVIMVSAKGESQAIFQAEDSLATDYFIKPFDPKELLRMIKRYI